MKISLLLLILCSNSFAYTFLTGQPYLDKNKPIYWTADSKFHDTTRDCLAQWSSATDGVLNFIESDGTQAPNITVKEGTLSIPQCGITNTDSNSNSIVTIDTSLGLDNTTCILHEIGHALGLGHSGDGPWTYEPPVMNAVVNPVVRILHKDDIDGIRALYGISTPYEYPLNILVTNRRGRVFTFMVSDIATPALFHWDFGDVPALGLLGQNPIKHRFRKHGVYTVRVFFRGFTGTLSLVVGRVKGYATNLHKQ